MITPFVEDCVQPCSYDVHLGHSAYIESERGFVPLDLSGFTEDRPFWLGPNEFMLGDTLETFVIPDNVEAHLHLVSSRAREGLNHSLAGLIDCGYRGRLTVELKNILRFGSIPLYPMLRIAQLTFFEYSEPAESPYLGRYFGDTKVSMVRDGEDVLQLQGI